MNTHEAYEIVDRLTPVSVRNLEDAYVRFMEMALLVDPHPETEDRATRDRETYTEFLLPPDENGNPVISVPGMHQFLSKITGHPLQTCVAFDYVDFHRVHGTTIEDAELAGYV
ncbi:hypothetical protein H1O16_gp206 [Burkholderia phage BcepSaruman]|uniref:Uncharacterized protein n=1 Tax=Burkholderia phage BcepSaruman TaxID=2530032 RepID=A0A4D5ZD43_9CAUD|nr:hypothetical protein H1O16_gp206 [Burkholderia phage BcepSaruman]QBX06619.1 hypothetical protein BcepSaruman_206 [Burkholderia phage BcepSaruman]